jgi:hypothetical protein
MDPFVRKMIFGGVAFGSAMLLMAGSLTAIYVHNRPRCNEAAISETPSPDGRWKAVVMERRCGEESPLYLHVNLSPAGDPIRTAYFSGRSEEGEVFLVEEETQELNPVLDWTSPGQLTIQCPRCRPASVQKRGEHWGPITVRYELQP